MQAWRRLAERDPLEKANRLGLRPKDWMVDLTNALDVPFNEALEDVGDAAKTLAAGDGSAVAAAAQLAAISLQKQPDAEALALWLGDAVLAHRLKWPALVPLIAGQISRSDIRAAARPDGDAWQTTWIKRFGAGCITLRRKPFLRPRLTWMAFISPRLRRCHTVCLETRNSRIV